MMRKVLALLTCVSFFAVSIFAAPRGRQSQKPPTTKSIRGRIHTTNKPAQTKGPKRSNRNSPVNPTRGRIR